MSTETAQLTSTRLNYLVENLEGAILLEDEHRKIVLVNHLFCDLFQIPLSPKDLVGISCAESAEQSKNLFADPESFVDRITEILEQKKAVQNEMLEMSDGRILERGYFPIFVQNQYAGHFWNYRDVTDFIQSNRQLQEKEEKLRLILDNTLDGVVGIDKESRITMWNAQAEHIFGWNREEAIGAKLDEMIIPPHYREQHLKGMERFFKTFSGPVIHNRIEITALRKNGEEFPIELTIIPNKIDGQYFFTSFIRDITARREAQNRQVEILDKLENANQNLKDFAHVVSHDLKAPLRGIASLASWITTDYEHLLDEEGKKHLQLLRGRVDRMHHLIEGILEYSRIDGIPKVKEWIPLRSVIKEVVDLIAPTEDVQITTDATLPVVMCDKVQIMQVFQNLIVNAIKYNDKTIKTVHIGSKSTPKYCRIMIRDNGIGIEEKYQEKIFQIFQTLHKKEEYDSTGVGLSLVKKIVESCKGQVQIQSAVGEGSTFTLVLPQELIKNE